MHQCKCTTGKNQQCSREALPGEETCWQHWPLRELSNTKKQSLKTKPSVELSQRYWAELDREKNKMLHQSPFYHEYLDFLEGLNDFGTKEQISFEQFFTLYNTAENQYENENPDNDDASLDDLPDKVRQAYLMNVGEKMGYFTILG